MYQVIPGLLTIHQKKPLPQIKNPFQPQFIQALKGRNMLAMGNAHLIRLEKYGLSPERTQYLMPMSSWRIYTLRNIPDPKA
jgi:hypothetical protein